MKCTKCERSFQSKRALSQHMMSKHTNNNGARPNGNFKLKRSTQEGGLIGGGRNVRPLHNKGVTLTGSDYLAKVTVKSSPTSASDRILASWPVTPSGFPGTRLTQLSELWERYRFLMFKLRYVAAVPNTLACQLALYIDTDPLDDPNNFTDADQLVRQAVAQAGSQQWNFNRAATIPLAKRGDDQLYYTGVDKQNERFNRQGTAYLIQITNPINFNGEVLTSDLEAGSVFLDWQIYFETAQINPPVVSQAPQLTWASVFGDGSASQVVDVTGSGPVAMVVAKLGGLETPETRTLLLQELGGSRTRLLRKTHFSFEDSAPEYDMRGTWDLISEGTGDHDLRFFGQDVTATLQ